MYCTAFCRVQVVLEYFIHHSMALDQHDPFELGTDDGDNKSVAGSVLGALVDDVNVGRLEAGLQLVLNQLRYRFTRHH